MAEQAERAVQIERAARARAVEAARAGRDESFDVVIVGARCAGSPLAALLARGGLDVAVVEQATFPRPTLSSHCIQADALAFLNRLGVMDEIHATGATLMTGTDTRMDDFTFAQDFPLRPGDPGGAASIRRHVLDPILRDAAVDAGASVRMATKVTDLLVEHGRVAGVRVVHDGEESVLRARLVVGADGRESTVARLRGARRYNLTTNERHYYWAYFAGADLAPTPRFVFHRWGDRHIFAGPADDGLYIVGVSPEVHERDLFRADLEGMLMEHVHSCAPVAKALANATLASKIHGILNFTGYFREAAGPGWVLLGDSGHFKDPAAGRGIGDAFHQASWLAPEIVRTLRVSDREVDRATRRFWGWRDRSYAPYYWLAADLGKEGPLPAVVPDVMARLYERGKIDEFLALFSHRIGPAQLVSPPRVVGAAARLLWKPPAQGRAAVAREVRDVLALELARRRKTRRPVFEEVPPDAGRRHRNGSGPVPRAASAAPAAVRGARTAVSDVSSALTDTTPAEEARA
ncbi:NAD(P)/FAD-dependent oxidoreductase [Yinghuangia seranimata]|uniref:NAD(P)/FAD-dependent oxidoreductase n=1 Tax=Yinghuangia seranimata TaxID=408067 RepID=UPI00248BDDB0|nr:NAD(P)/FAD-dependent oxidoreductase [Yinghuangia seranimata]MDI2127656.1 NAD(P)/FAD-dependent oxidoreductase [Yinghuangia seranimata]